MMTKLDERSRQDAIVSALERVGRASVTDLSREFGVSTVTIRKDLTALEERGELQRVHGGATRTTARDVGAFPARLTTGAEEKRAIARRAAGLVREGSVIALDSSSSAYFLAKELLDVRNLTVVTYSIPIAALFLDRSSAEVHMVGGVVNRSARAVTADGVTLDMDVDLFFCSAHAVSLASGLMEPDAEEGETKAALAARSKRRYALLLSSKFEAEPEHPWLDVRELTGIITDRNLPAATLAEWRGAGVPIDRAK